jgi:hypothetical protein
MSRKPVAAGKDGAGTKGRLSEGLHRGVPAAGTLKVSSKNADNEMNANLLQPSGKGDAHGSEDG